MVKFHSIRVSSYFRGLIFSHIMIVLMSIILIGVITYEVSVKNLLEEVQETNHVLLNNIVNSVNMVLNTANDLSVQIAVDPYVNELSRFDNEDDDELKLKVLQIQDFLISSRSSRDSLNSIYLYYRSSHMLISSQDGKYSIDNFFDSGWLFDYYNAEDKDRLFMWNGPRMLKKDLIYPIAKSGEDDTAAGINGQWVISIIRPMGLIPDRKNGLVVINIPENALFNMYKDVKLGKTGEMFITDSSGRIISHRDKNKLNTLNKAKYMEKVLEIKEDGNFTFDDGSRKYYISVKNSGKSDWRYVAVIPYNELVEKVDNLKKLIAGVCVLYLLIGSVLSYFASRRMYKPIGKVMNVIAKKFGKSQDQLGYQVSDLSLILNDVIDSNENLQNLWQKYYPLMEERFLTRLLQGKIANMQELDERLKLIGMNFEFYSVLLICFDDYKEIRGELGEQEINLIKMYIFKSIDEYLSSSGLYKGKSVDIDEDKFTILMGSNTVITSAELYTIAESLKKKISDTRLGSYSIGISRVMEGMNEIKNCYNQAKASLNHKFYMGKGNIILIDDVEPITEEAEILLQTEEEEAILNLLRSYDQEQLQKEINKSLEIRFVKSKLGLEYIQPVLTQLIHIFNRFLSEKGYSLKDMVDDSPNFFVNLMRAETLEDVRFTLKALLEKIFTVLKEKKENKHSEIIENVKSYLNNNYNKDISLDSMADQVYMSKFYLSKLFKKEVGENFNEYLINLRIERAKALLENSSIKIFEIAQRVGYVNHKSFTKIFKENVGVTPVQYRDEAVLKKLKSADMVKISDQNKNTNDT